MRFDPDTTRRLLNRAAISETSTGREAPAIDIGWALPPETNRLLALLIEEAGCKSILEFGAGSSSVTLARALVLRGGGQLTSIDHAPHFSRDAWAEVSRLPGVDAELVVARIGWTASSDGLFRTYKRTEDALRRRAPYDLVLIDGPPGGVGRGGTLHHAAPYLQPGAIVVLDDYQRAGEQAYVQRWLEHYPGLEALHLSTTFGRGVAVLRMNDNRPARTARRWMSSVMDAGRFKVVARLKRWMARSGDARP